MRRDAVCAVYIPTNAHHTVLYVGVTSDLPQRIREHRSGIHERTFTRRYNCTKLVCFETTKDIRAAIARETQIKKWSREKKERLIEATNPEWQDLAAEWE
jgi:putative endonuclease